MVRYSISRGGNKVTEDLQKAFDTLKNTEAALQICEHRLTAVFEKLPGVVFFIAVEPDEKFRFSRINQAFLASTGLSENQVVGKLIQEVIPPESVNLVLKNYKECIRTRSTVRWEEASEYPTGLMYGEVAVSPIFDESGACTQLVGLVLDTTERKRVELEREQYYKFFLNSSDIMVIVDDKDRLTKVNPACSQILGYSEQAILKKPFLDFIHPDDIQMTLAAMTEARQVGRSVNFENRILCKDGETRWLSWNAQLAAGERLTYATARNITERKRLEMDLRAAVEARDEFLSIASHELKTPLTALTLQLQLLIRIASQMPINPEMVTLLATKSMKASNQIASLLNELLDITRIRVGKLTLEKREMDLSSAAANILSFLSEEITASGSKVQILAEEPVIGYWDPNRINQIVSNLLSNAIKYGAGKPIKVTVRINREAGAAEFRVLDHGVGISRDVQETIFQRFERAVSGGKIAGLGLGLYIVRQVVEAHGGVIRVESEPGRGSLFTVTLPLRHA